MKKNATIILSIILILSAFFLLSFYIYQKDKNKYEPKLWIGFFDYRLNLRDVGESLNSCLKKQTFQTGLVFRSNRYFSGWSCDKIHNPDKIYSLNFSPWNPHAYYCTQPSGKRQFGSHPNFSFELSDIERLSNWNKPEFKTTMCLFIKETLSDLTQDKSILYHCDMGRDRTGAYTALLVMMMAEQKKLEAKETTKAIECDYEKTTSLEHDKIGRMTLFMQEMAQQGGVSAFVEQQCGISQSEMKQAAAHFVN